MCDEYNSLNTISDTSLPLIEPDSPKSSCSLVCRDGEWQMPLDEDNMSYQSQKGLQPPPPSIHISIIQYAEILPNSQNSFQ